jgi:hypothetical protein
MVGAAALGSVGAADGPPVSPAPNGWAPACAELTIASTASAIAGSP